MAAESQPSDPAFYATVDRDLYADVISAGGLASAIIDAATGHGLVLEGVEEKPGEARFSTTGIASEYRTASILLGARERRFSIVVARGRYIHASGGTDDLASVAKVIGYWFGGPTLPELAARFPFMAYSALALAYEEGNPVEFQWRTLLQDDDFTEVRPLLEAVYAVESFRSLFPLISHNTQLRLHDDADNKSARQFWITMRSSGIYHVEKRTGTPRGEVVSSLASVIELLASYVRLP